MKFVLCLAFLVTSIAAFGEDDLQNFKNLPVAHRPEVVVTSLNDLVSQIVSHTGGQAFTAHQFLGFSGATFADIPGYKREFEMRARELNRETQKTLGAKAVTVYILGGSVDGFGVGYEVLRTLMESGEIANALVVGMVSDQALGYHLEGLAKGWGNVISPAQKILLAKETYIDSQGNRSWELKDSEIGESDTPKVLKDLSRKSGADVMTFNVFGGGAQAFNETLEMILESRNRPHRVNIELFAGHQPGKVAKDTGYRAADMLAYVIFKNRFLLTDKIKVTVHSKVDGKTVDIQKFDQTSEYAKVDVDLAMAPGQIDRFKDKELTPEEKAALNYSLVLNQLKDLPLKEINNFRLRSSRQLAEARQLLGAGYRGMAEQAMLGNADHCANCAADSVKTLETYNNRQGLNCRDLLTR